MAKVQKVWMFCPPRPLKHKVPENVNAEVEAKARELAESFLKPKYIKPARKNARFTYVVDIYTKWYRSYFYFLAKRACPGPNAIAPFFESKFARLEYIGKNRFNLSYMRYTGQWIEIHPRLSLNECLTKIKNEPHFMP